MVRLYIIALVAVSLMGLAAMFMVPRAQPVPVIEATGAPVAKSEAQALMLQRDASGQFHLDVAVNGSQVNFLVDTGADLVALTEQEAQTLGLNVFESSFQPMMQTASGVGYGAPITLDEIEIAGKTMHEVDAVVVKGLTVNLLGQSVLRQLGGIELKGDKMVIRSH